MNINTLLLSVYYYQYIDVLIDFYLINKINSVINTVAFLGFLLHSVWIANATATLFLLTMSNADIIIPSCP